MVQHWTLENRSLRLQKIISLINLHCTSYLVLQNWTIMTDRDCLWTLTALITRTGRSVWETEPLPHDYAVETSESCSRGVGEWTSWDMLTGNELQQSGASSLHPFIPERTDVCCWSSLDNTTAVTLSPVWKFRIMRVIFSASWIFQGWITHFVLALCTQVCFCKWFWIARDKPGIYYYREVIILHSVY